MTATSGDRPRVRASGAFRRLVRTAALAVLAALFALSARDARADLRKLEAEFKGAIQRLETATVVVVPRGAPGAPGLSGVIVSKTGLVLTHSDAGRVDERKRGQAPKTRLEDEVDVRVPNLKTGAFTNYRARILKRMPEIHSALAQVVEGPRAGFTTFLVPGTSAEVRVGSFTFAMGNAFGMGDESSPSLTAGVVAALGRSKDPRYGGTVEAIYTTAAINPGVGGGPVVDVRGRLVGTVAGWVDAASEPTSPFQFLGRVVPMDRLRAAWEGFPEAKPAFSATAPKLLETPESSNLERVLAHTASTARASVVSIDVRRKVPVSSTTLGPDGRPLDLPRYRGPVSGIVVSEDGLVATALYNVTNLGTLTQRFPVGPDAFPAAATTKAGIDAIEGATVTLSDGTSCAATLAAVHEPLGLAIFRAELPEGRRLAVLPPAPPETFTEGRFVVALGNPYGAETSPDPLLTFGILSKRHADAGGEMWRGHWQTDARGTDGNCGGAVVDLRGRLVGMLTLWDPVHHQRASGIAFVLPWERLAAALPALAAGRSFRRPFLGVRWRDAEGARIEEVIADTAAKSAGLLAGDEIIEMDGRPVGSREDFAGAIGGHFAGDVVKLKVRRGPDLVEIDVTLGARD